MPAGTRINLKLSRNGKAFETTVVLKEILSAGGGHYEN
jgi:hypothetical protein